VAGHGQEKTMSPAVEFVMVFIAALCAVCTVMTVAIMASPWDNLEWRLLAISGMALMISLLTLWITVTTI
jgi:hypothetical protein